MLKRIKTVALTCIFTILVCAAKVQASSDNLIVNKDKIWTIKFNKEVQLDEATKKEIKIKDSKGKEVNCNLKLGKNNKSIIVDAPTGGYNLEEKYTLTVGNNIYSKKKAKLKNGTTMQFTIKKYDENDVVTFKDKNLEKAVRDTIKKANGNLYQRDLEKITMLNMVDYNIKNIDQIEHLTNLQGLWMGGIKVKELSPLKELTKLKIINATQCDINDISALKDLKNLKYLYLSINNISDITSLKGLVNLEDLDLDSNNISDVTSLGGLYNLKCLTLNDNKISDIGALGGLNNMKSLSLQKNKISDISTLKDLKNIKYLVLKDNEITNITPLINLKKLDGLYLAGNNIKYDPELKEFYENIQLKDFRFDCDDNLIEF